MTYKLINGLVIPAGNQTNQTMGGDISGTTNTTTVTKIQGRTVASTAPADGYVLAWNVGNNDWEPTPLSSVNAVNNSVTNLSITTDGYELTGTTTNNISVVNIDKNNTFALARGGNFYTSGNESGSNTPAFDAWVSMTSLSAVNQRFAACGVFQAALTFGGTGSGTSASISSGQVYNGNSWSAASGTLSANKADVGTSGAQNSALIFGGQGVASTDTQRYNGSSWATMGNLTTGVFNPGGCGTQAAALCIGGGASAASTTGSTTTEKFNGNVWSNTGALVSATTLAAACGIQQAALLISGSIAGSVTTTTESFNGSTWINTNQGAFGVSGNAASGSQGWCLVFGGTTTNAQAGAVGSTARWNGYYWLSYNISGLNTGREFHGGCGTRENGIAFGGDSTGATVATTEHFIGSYYESFPTQMFISVINDNTSNASVDEFDVITSNDNLVLPIFSPFRLTIIETFNQFNNPQFDYLQGDGFWSAGGTLNSARFANGGCGTSKAAVTFAGQGTVSFTPVTELYNGTSWSNSGSINNNRDYSGSAGYQNSALAISGGVGLFSTEKFNGATWSTTGNVNTAVYFLASSGTQNAALKAAGTTNGVNNAVSSSETFNGSVWSTTSASLSAAKFGSMGTGIQNSSLCIGGVINNGANVISTVEKYNGSVWNIVGGLLTVRFQGSSCGQFNAAMTSAGGQDNTSSTQGAQTSEKFNGVFWSPTSALSTARYLTTNRCGASLSPLVPGGGNGSVSPTALSSTEAYIISNTNLIPSGLERYRVSY